MGIVADRITIEYTDRHSTQILRANFRIIHVLVHWLIRSIPHAGVACCMDRHNIVIVRRTQRDWRQWVRELEAEEQVTRIRRRVVKGRPYETEAWVKRIVAEWSVQGTVRSLGVRRSPPQMIQTLFGPCDSSVLWRCQGIEPGGPCRSIAHATY